MLIASPPNEARATGVRFSDDTLTVILDDGREITVPLAWFPRLRGATTEERGKWKLVGKGRGIHWAAVDEDISVAGLLGEPT